MDALTSRAITTRTTHNTNNFVEEGRCPPKDELKRALQLEPLNWTAEQENEAGEVAASAAPLVQHSFASAIQSCLAAIPSTNPSTSTSTSPSLIFSLSAASDEEMVTNGAPSVNHVDDHDYRHHVNVTLSTLKQQQQNNGNGHSCNVAKIPTPFTINDILGWGKSPEPEPEQIQSTSQPPEETETMDMRITRASKTPSPTPAAPPLHSSSAPAGCIGEIPILSIPFPRSNFVDTTSSMKPDEPLNLSIAKKRKHNSNTSSNSGSNCNRNKISDNGTKDKPKNKSRPSTKQKSSGSPSGVEEEEEGGSSNTFSPALSVGLSQSTFENVLLPNDVIIPTFKSSHHHLKQSTGVSTKNGNLKGNMIKI